VLIAVKRQEAKTLLVAKLALQDMAAEWINRLQDRA
jgi:hypothetical protein